LKGLNFSTITSRATFASSITSKTIKNKTTTIKTTKTMKKPIKNTAQPVQAKVLKVKEMQSFLGGAMLHVRKQGGHQQEY